MKVDDDSFINVPALWRALKGRAQEKGDTGTGKRSKGKTLVELNCNRSIPEPDFIMGRVFGEEKPGTLDEMLGEERR